MLGVKMFSAIFYFQKPNNQLPSNVTWFVVHGIRL